MTFINRFVQSRIAAKRHEDTEDKDEVGEQFHGRINIVILRHW